jgi:anthranilate synthase component I
MAGAYHESAAVFEPGIEAFAASFSQGKPQVVWTRLVADLETPVSAYMKLAQQEAGKASTVANAPMSFLLESVEGGINRGRYSMIGIAPDLIFRAQGERAEVNRDARDNPAAFKPLPGKTLEALRALLAESAIELPEQLPPMAVGVFGYMGYDTVRLVEHLPKTPPDGLGVPDALLMRPTVMVIFDAIKVEMIIVTPVYPALPNGKKTTSGKGTKEASAAYDDACARLRAAMNTLDDPVPHAAAMATAPVEPPTPTSNMSPETFMADVRKAKEYVAAGDVFQVVLSQRFSAPFTLPPFALYRALRRTNPSPFLFHLELGGFSLVGSSPEILVRVRDGEVTIRPLAGTRRRGATPEEDKALEGELLADPKERAEHLMLLDLGRNDVGRVAEIGSVRVTEQFVVERYSHVMHMSSHVVGKLDPRHDIIDALMAGFPAGTLSGAPKVRAMEIIDELESTKRGPYAGCVGYFSADGQMDTCIVLRTALVKDGVMHVQAGAGVVADSVPEAEQAECQDKARALFRAAEEAHRIAGSAIRGNR